MLDTRTIPLPSPELNYPASGVGVVTALRERRSRTEFAPGPVSLTALAAILNESAGVTERFGRGTPSPARAYPLDCVVAACDVTGLPPAFYRYDARAHTLTALDLGVPPRPWLEAVLANKAIAQTEAAHVFVAAHEDLAGRKYGENALRFLLLEAGHLVQSVLLLAEHEHLGACAIGKFDTAEAGRLLGPALEGAAVVHGAAIGRLAG